MAEIKDREIDQILRILLHVLLRTEKDERTPETSTSLSRNLCE